MWSRLSSVVQLSLEWHAHFSSLVITIQLQVAQYRPNLFDNALTKRFYESSNIDLTKEIVEKAHDFSEIGRECGKGFL